MDEDSDSANWVLINEIDCAEEALTLDSQPSTATDSDHDSDGSISIISDHPTDSYSEEEHEQAVKTQDVKIIAQTSKLNLETPTLVIEDENMVQVPEVESSVKTDVHVEDISKEVTDISHEASDGDVSTTSDSSSSKQWAYVDEKSKPELNTLKKPFYLDCSQEPILEISSNETTEADTESTISSKECQTVTKKQDNFVSNISNRESNRDGAFNKIGIGILISMMVLVGSHLIQRYSENQDDMIQSPSESFLEGFADNEKARAIINVCIDRQKSKGEYSENAVEKCVIKKLKKKNREEAMKKTEIYLQMKERILELREKELADKEKKILQTWRKKGFGGENRETYKKKGHYGTEHRKQDDDSRKFKEFDKHFKEQSDFKGKKRRDHQEGVVEKEGNGKYRSHFFRPQNSWESEESMQIHKKSASQNQNPCKKYKNHKSMEEDFQILKEKVKKSFSKQNLKNLKGDRKEDPNEEWYIKYNPAKNTIELINITTLPEKDSLLIKNGNKTINGQWYFSLYGVSRANIRSKEKEAEWYFKRGHFRENKRDKAKWYFEYMSARDDTRCLY